MAWYNNDWNYRVKVTVLASKVDADLTDFPVYVSLADLPAGFHTNVNQTDGRDIRVTTSNGTTEVPREVVFYDSATDTGELHFKGDVNATTDTDFYIYYGNASATEPAEDATYGRENVWRAEYKAVYHLKEDVNVDAGGYLDSTANDNDMTGVSMAMTAPTAKLGIGAEFDGGADYLEKTSPANVGFTTAYSVSAWIKSPHPPTGEYHAVFNKGTATASDIELYHQPGNSSLVVAHNRNNAGTFDFIGFTAWPSDTMFHLVVTHESGVATKAYYDAVSQTINQQTSPLANPANTAGHLIRLANVTHSIFSPAFFDGVQDEVRVYGGVLPATWISTEYNNQNDPSTFFTIGAQEEPPTEDGFVVVLI